MGCLLSLQWWVKSAKLNVQCFKFHRRFLNFFWLFCAFNFIIFSEKVTWPVSFYIETDSWTSGQCRLNILVHLVILSPNSPCNVGLTYKNLPLYWIKIKINYLLIFTSEMDLKCIFLCRFYIFVTNNVLEIKLWFIFS